MANAFGRGSSWAGGTGPSPTNLTANVTSAHSDKPSSQQLIKYDTHSNRTPTKTSQYILVREKKQNSNSFPQSFQTFVEKNSEETSLSKAMTADIAPNKQNETTKLSLLGNKKRSSTFLNPKRKKVDEDQTKWTREKLIHEINRIQDASDEDVNLLNEQDLRKKLFNLMTNPKKQKKEEGDTMDIGKLLLDSTMDYSPRLCEDSTDAAIQSLEKHDAILELANFIQKCGKRANMHKLNNTSLQELHENLILARDEHKSVKLVFPELSGTDARWFGPKSERNDKDYEPESTGSVDDNLDDWWDNITDNEIENITQEPDKKQDLREEHDKLFQQLLQEASKNPQPQIKGPDVTLNWTKEDFTKEIIALGNTLGKPKYSSVLMNTSIERLRAQFDTLTKQVRELQSSTIKSQSQNVNRTNEVGDEGEFEWTDDSEVGTSNDMCTSEHKCEVKKEKENKTKNKKEEKEIKIKKEENKTKIEKTENNPESSKNDNVSSMQKGIVTPEKSKNENVGNPESDDEVRIITPTKPSTAQDTEPNQGLTIFTSNTPNEIIEVLERFTMISIISKRLKNDKQPQDFMLQATIVELQNILKHFRDTLGLEEIHVTRSDEDHHSKREMLWKEDLEHRKQLIQANSEPQLPGSFASTFVLPSARESVQKSTPQTAPNAPPVKAKPSTQSDEVTLEMTDNEKGVDISMFTPKTSSDFKINEPPENGEPQKENVVMLTERIFNIRIAYGLKHRNHHIPTEIKNFVRVLRNIDSNIKILPFKEGTCTTYQDEEVVTNEKDLPDTKEQLAKWAAEIEISYNNKLHFSIRTASVLKFGEIRRHLYPWCSKTKSFVKFDDVGTKKIFGIGWILGIHPSFHNRNSLKSVLFKDAPNLMDKVVIYPRRVWTDSDDNNQKTITNGIVIDGCFWHRDKILQHLCTFKWTGDYRDATFIPFKVSEQFTKQHQRKAMQEQNIYLRDSWSKIINVSNSVGMLTCLETKRKFTFITWLKLCEIHGKRILKSVEYIDKEKVRIIYHKDNEYNVCNMLTHLFPAIEKQFGESIAIELLGNKENQMEQIKTKCLEHSYANICAKNIMQRGTPQEKVINKPPQVKFNSYYGKKINDSNNVQKSTNENRETTKNKRTNEIREKNEPSESQVNIERQNIESNETVIQLRKAVAELQSAQSKQSQTITDLNEKLLGEKDSSESSCASNASGNLHDEIQALWKSQDEKYASLKGEMKDEMEELRTDMNQQIQTTKGDLIELIDENKSSITKEIESLRSLQEESTSSLREQQAVNSSNIMDAINKLANKITTITPPSNPNPPIIPVEQSSRHGGQK